MTNYDSIYVDLLTQLNSLNVDATFKNPKKSTFKLGGLDRNNDISIKNLGIKNISTYLNSSSGRKAFHFEMLIKNKNQDIVLQTINQINIFLENDLLKSNTAEYQILNCEFDNSSEHLGMTEDLKFLYSTKFMLEIYIK